MQTQTKHEGYWKDAKGRLVPPELVAPLDQLRDHPRCQDSCRVF